MLPRRGRSCRPELPPERSKTHGRSRQEARVPEEAVSPRALRREEPRPGREGPRRIEWAGARRCRCCTRSASASRSRSRSRACAWRRACTSPRRPRTSRSRCKAGGADVVLCASNPLSTQDDVAAALVASTASASSPSRARTTRPTTGTSTRRSSTGRTSPWTTARTWSAVHPQRAHGAAAGRASAAPRRPPPASSASARWPRDGVLGYPIVAVNDARHQAHLRQPLRHRPVDLDGIIRATNRLLAGSIFVVAGYGWCGRGVAHARQGHGRRRGGHRDRPAQGARGGDGRLPR